MFPSILIQLENGPNKFYFYFYFVLRHLLVAKKICKTKNKKTMALAYYFYLLFKTHNYDLKDIFLIHVNIL